MSLLTTPQRPATLLHRTSTTSKSHTRHTSKSTTLDLITPALNVSIVIGTALKSVLHTLSIIALYQITTTLQYTSILLKEFFVQARWMSIVGAKLMSDGVKLGWKSTERARQRLFFEFMVFILGCGNGILLLLFWPGWIFIGMLVALTWVCR